MTAEAEILIEELADALAVPHLGVVEQGAGHYSYLETEAGYERRPVVLGTSNERVQGVVATMPERSL